MEFLVLRVGGVDADGAPLMPLCGPLGILGGALIGVSMLDLGVVQSTTDGKQRALIDDLLPRID